MTMKKPTLQPGEYLPPQQVEYSKIIDGFHFSGPFTVELGAEFKNDCRFNKHTRRYVRVNGVELDMYAMAREEGVRTPRRILREEPQLLERAAEWYIAKVLRPQREEAARLERMRQRELSQESADNWFVEVGDTEAVIQRGRYEVFFADIVTLSSGTPEIILSFSRQPFVI